MMNTKKEKKERKQSIIGNTGTIGQFEIFASRLWSEEQ